MSRWQYDRNCPGCRPVALDLQTGELCPPDHPLQKAMDDLWATTPDMTKAAFHHVTCQNSRAMLDLALAESFMAKVKERTKDI